MLPHALIAEVDGVGLTWMRNCCAWSTCYKGQSLCSVGGGNENLAWLMVCQSICFVLGTASSELLVLHSFRKRDVFHHSPNLYPVDSRKALQHQMMAHWLQDAQSLICSKSLYVVRFLVNVDSQDTDAGELSEGNAPH